VKKTRALHGTRLGLRSEASPQPKASTTRFRVGVVFVAVLLAAGIASIGSRRKNAESQPASAPVAKSGGDAAAPSPKTLAELVALSPAQLAQCDIGLMNLLCAERLRGAEKLDVTDHIARLDGIAKHVEFETRRHLYRFWNNRAEFNNSEAYFRMLLMAVTLQGDLRMRYNPQRITPVGEFEPNEVFFADSRDVFIHGLIADYRRMGTCSSMPVLYVAVGRRLGYPLKLVPTQNHLFVRWEDSRERFNVDATGRGMNMYDDDHYRQWPMPFSREEEQEFGYLKSMTPTDELTEFLGLRGHCLFAMGKAEEGVEAQEMALRLSPDSRLQQLITAMAREQQQRQSSPVAYLPPELRDPLWPRPKLPPVQLHGVAGFAPVVPADPNPLDRIRNQ